ncbi:diacylglycerol/lipid kinase family protein [Subtercola sp. YIM 133946]|uniref:diacylglycerol/lipid kinase family protein n=1 Tax=Subtercola sp. YIM 133946 TaxID=3118909 RepID=UPI002F921D40
MTDDPPKVAAVVYNPVKVDLPRLREAVESEAASAGWGAPLWFETTVDDGGQGMTRRALDAKVDVVIAAGGDGTVRCVAEGMRGSATPLALLPSGTGNLLARNLKLTLNDLPGSVRSAFTGVDRDIDLGVIDIEREDAGRDRHVFVVMAGMGIDAKMIENTNDDLKKKAGWVAYIGAVVVSMRDRSELHLRYSLDGGRSKRRTVNTLIIGNCGSLPGNILLMPDAVVDDGLFDVLLMRPRGVFGWPRVYARVAWINRISRRKAGASTAGESRPDDELRYKTGTTLVARLRQPAQIELDGDSFGAAAAFSARLEPGGLKLRVPAPAAGVAPAAATSS